VIIFLLILAGSLLHAYLFWRISSLPWVNTHLRKRRLWLSAALLWLLYVVGNLYGHGGTGGITGRLGGFAMDWLGVLFIATTMMLFSELLTGFGLWARRYVPLLRKGALLGAMLLTPVALVQGYLAPVVVRHEVALAGLPLELDGTRVAVLSDLHLGSRVGAEWLAERIAQVRAINPDMIVILGDSFEGYVQPDPAFAPLFHRLQAPFGVYAVTGNHEFYGDPGAVITMTEAAGVVWLRDCWRQVVPGLILAGVDDLSTRRRSDEAADVVSRVLRERPPGAVILLSHTAWQAEAAAGSGAGLMLSGHNHGGQIWPFGYLVRYFYPLFVGRYEVDGMTVIVSRGTGLWGPRMRLWLPGEIIEVTLLKP
jgi:predicted MPP superfamily phosphohydrolase